MLCHFLGEKIYNCAFSVLRIISQQKVMVGALVMSWRLCEPKKIKIWAKILGHLLGKKITIVIF